MKEIPKEIMDKIEAEAYKLSEARHKNGMGDSTGIGFIAGANYGYQLALSSPSLRWVKASEAVSIYENFAIYKDGHYKLKGLLVTTDDGYEFRNSNLSITIAKDMIENVWVLSKSPSPDDKDKRIEALEYRLRCYEKEIDTRESKIAELEKENGEYRNYIANHK